MPVDGHLANHVAASEKRRHRLQQLAAAPQHTNTARPEHLVPAERQEVAAKRAHVHRQMRHALRAIHQHQRPGGVRPRDDLARSAAACPARSTAARRRRAGAGALRAGCSKAVHIQLAIVRHAARSAAARWCAARRAARARDCCGAPSRVTSSVSPGLRLASPQECATRLIASVALRVKMTSRTLARVDETRNLLARALVGGGGLLAERVGAAVDVGVGLTLEAVHRREHLRGGFCEEAALSRKTSGLPWTSRARMGKVVARGQRRNGWRTGTLAAVSTMGRTSFSQRPQSLAQRPQSLAQRTLSDRLLATHRGHKRAPACAIAQSWRILDLFITLCIPPRTPRCRHPRLLALAGEPLVALLLQLEREVRAAGLDDAGRGTCTWTMSGAM